MPKNFLGQEVDAYGNPVGTPNNYSTDQGFASPASHMPPAPVAGAGGGAGMPQGRAVTLSRTGADRRDAIPGALAPALAAPMGGAVGDPRLAQQAQARAEQNRVIQELQRQAAGDPNSLAQKQLAGSYQQAQAQQSSLGSTMRGQSAGAAQRSIQAGQSGIERGRTGDQQMLMAREQDAAQAMLAQALAQQQGQDIGQASAVAQDTLGSQAQGNATDQFYASNALHDALAGTQRANSEARSQMGINEAQGDLTRSAVNTGINTGASALSTYQQFANNGNNNGNYRTVDGQNSIVPAWDK